MNQKNFCLFRGNGQSEGRDYRGSCAIYGMRTVIFGAVVHHLDSHRSPFSQSEVDNRQIAVSLLPRFKWITFLVNQPPIGLQSMIGR
jgi:hypothetical protein